jgi:hypothetical protein
VKGGIRDGSFPVHRCAVSPHGLPGFHQPDPGGVAPAGPPFEAAFHAHMAAWRLDGTPRAARRFTVYETCPLPTPEDRLLFMLASLKTSALQVVQGRVCGMGQSKAKQ